MTSGAEASPIDPLPMPAAVATPALPLSVMSKEVEQNEPHNLAILALHMVVVRIGWIFKTESVIMPAYLDLIAGAGWLRGMLVVLNRVGQSVPPLVFGPWFESLPRKKWALLGSSLAMAIPFLSLALIQLLAQGRAASWLPTVFLLLYTLFSVCTGLNQLTNCTLQGKLIRVTRRGRLLSIATFCGTVPAILCALWLLRLWLTIPGGGGYVYIFGFTGICFLVAAVLVVGLREPAEVHAVRAGGFQAHLASSWRVVRQDANLRRLCWVAMLFSTVLILFPHYQAFARQRLGLTNVNLMIWVVVQNIGTGLSSLGIGPLADTRGNRLTLRVVLLAAALAPIAAIIISGLEPELARKCFWVVFLIIGLTPMAMKTLDNYTLEICTHEEHIHYQSTLNIALVAPFFFSPLVGWLIDKTSFESVFVVGAALIVASGLLTFTLREPRQQ